MSTAEPVQPFSNRQSNAAVDTSDIPSEWSTDCEGKGVTVEIFADDEWIEIPTTEVELYEVAGKSASVQRSAKVQFPMEWGGKSVINVLQQHRPYGDSSILMARVFMETEDGWFCKHIGWIGGLGQSGEPSVGKMWIYDFAEFFDGIPFQASWEKNVTFETLISDVVSSFVNATGVSVDATTGVEPSRKYIDTGDDPDGFVETVVATVLGRVSPLDTSFRPDKHTLQDAIDRLEKFAFSKIYFQPSRDGDSLFLAFEEEDSEPAVVVQDEVAEFGEVEEYDEVATVIENDALYDMIPKNTIYLKGGDSSGWVEKAQLLAGGASGVHTIIRPSARDYPVIKVQAEPLVQAAGGQELAPPVVNTSTENVETAEQEARKRLKEEASDPSEGTIKLLEEPKISVDDILHAYEVCGDIVEVQPESVRYQIEEAKHVKRSGERLKTRLRVSVALTDDDIQTIFAEQREY